MTLFCFHPWPRLLFLCGVFLSIPLSGMGEESKPPEFGSEIEVLAPDEGSPEGYRAFRIFYPFPRHKVYFSTEEEGPFRQAQANFSHRSDIFLIDDQVTRIYFRLGSSSKEAVTYRSEVTLEENLRAPLILLNIVNDSEGSALEPYVWDDSLEGFPLGSLGVVSFVGASLEISYEESTFSLESGESLLLTPGSEASAEAHFTVARDFEGHRYTLFQQKMSVAEDERMLLMIYPAPRGGPQIRPRLLVEKENQVLEHFLRRDLFR